MPTIRDGGHVIGSQGGDDYSEIATWEATENGIDNDLITGDEILQGKIRAETFSSAVDFAAWTTQAANYIELIPYDASSYHDGSIGSGPVLTVNSSGYAFRTEEVTRMTGLEINNTGSGGAIQLDYADAGYIERCILKAGTHGIFAYRDIDDFILRNNLCYECGHTGIYVNNENTTSNLSVLGNTIADCTTNGIYTGGTQLNNDVLLSHNVCSGNGTDYNLNSSLATGSGYNASLDGSENGDTGDFQLSGDPFVDSSNDDYTISASSELYDAGDTSVTDLSEDCIGTARPQGTYYDVGWFEVVAGGTTRQLLASLTGASITPSAAATIIRDLLATLSGASTTPSIAATSVRDLLATLSGASTTPSIAATTVRDLLATLSGASTTPSIAATTVRDLLATLSGASVTPSIAATTVRDLLATLSGASVTPDDVVATLGAIISLAAAIAGASTTPTPVATIVRDLLATLSGASVTPSIAATTVRDLLATLSGASTTPSAAATTVRDLLATLSGASVTPDDVVATVEAIISLVAAIAGASTTPAAVATTVRDLLATVSGASTTPSIAATTVRDLLATLSGASVTPDDIVATLETVISLIAAITGASTTPTPVATTVRDLLATLSGASATPAAAATMARDLLANLSGASLTPSIAVLLNRALLADLAAISVTPDDLILILEGLGYLLAPTIVSTTVPRSIVSTTPTRTIH